MLLRVADEKSQDYQTYLNRRYDNVRKLAGDAGNRARAAGRGAAGRVRSGFGDKDSGGNPFSADARNVGAGPRVGRGARARRRRREGSGRLRSRAQGPLVQGRPRLRERLYAVRDRDGHRFVSRSPSSSHDDAGTPDLFHSPRIHNARRNYAGRACRSRSKKRSSAHRTFPEDSRPSIAIWRSTSCRWRIACGSISGRTSGSCSGRRS